MVVVVVRMLVLAVVLSIASLSLVEITAMVMMAIPVVASTTNSISVSTALTIIELAVTAALSSEFSSRAAAVIVITGLERLVLGGLPSKEATTSVVMSTTTHATAHAATTSMVMATAVHIITISALRLLTIRRDHSWLIASTSHVTHGHRLAIEVSTISARKVGSAVAAASSAAASTTSSASRRISALVFRFCLFYINSAAVDLCHRVVFDKILCDSFCSESDKAKATRRSSVDVLQDYRILDVAELIEVVFELLTSELEVETAHKDLALGVSEFHGVLRVTATHVIFLNHLAVRVRFLNLLSIVTDHEVIVVVMASVMIVTNASMATVGTALVVVGRLDIHSLVHDVVALGLVCRDDPSLHLQSLILVAEAQKNEAEAAPSLSQAIAHHNGILNLAVLLEILLQVGLLGRECEAADEQLDLVLLCGLVEAGRGSVASATAA